MALLYGVFCSVIFVNDLALKFIIPTLLLLADGRNIWLEIVC